MVQQVELWLPPTKDHIEMKKFMLEQLKISRHSPDYSMQQLEIAQQDKTPMQFYEEEVESAKWHLNYSVEHKAEEEKRAKERTEWIKRLRSSLQAVTR
jgi:hypothetical protein